MSLSPLLVWPLSRAHAYLTHARAPSTQEPIITWSFIIGGVGELERRRGERERDVCFRPRSIDRGPTLTTLSLHFPGLALPLVVPPLREATAKPTAKYSPPPVADLIAKASAN